MKKFHDHLEHERIVAALREVAAQTTGDIRVVVSRRKLPDPLAAAQQEFHRYGLDKISHAALILVAPRSKTFAIIGGPALHERLGDAFWRKVADAMAAEFAQEHPTQAILHGIAAAGSMLAQHFPRPQT